MRAILMSIKPKYVSMILNGEKTIEIRKTMPKCELPIKVYIYCTKKKSCLGKIEKGEELCGQIIDKEIIYKYPTRFELDNGGKVVAKFTLNKVETITYDSTYKLFKLNNVLQNSCLKEKEYFEKLEKRGMEVK